MSEYGFRPATVADLPTILRAERAYIAAVEPDQMSSWTAAIDRNLTLWITHLEHTTVLELEDRDDGRVTAGFVMWMPDTGGGHSTISAATLITIQVLLAHRQQGLGLRLLDVFANQARAAGARTLRLGVHERNPARSLYPKVGYTLTGHDGDYLLYELTDPA